MRTPLTTITAYLDAIDDGVTEFDTATSSVLSRQTGRLLRLADDIGDVSRAEEGHLDLRPEPVSLAELAANAAEPLRAEFNAAGITLRLVPASPGAAAVIADPARIGQVLTNLLTNALRHTPTGGTVTIGTTNDAAGARITVTDNGDGIPAARLPHIFERFYRGDTARDRAHGGSGIGLTIARAITEAHHGSLTAHSDGPGRGATFRLTLPPAEESPLRPR